MKILLFTPSLNVGGVETFVCNLAKWLSKNQDNEVYLVMFANEMNEKFDYIKSEKVKLLTLNKKAGFSISFLLRLYRLIKKINPDIINTHSSRTLRYLLCLPINRKYKIVHTITNNPRIYNPKLYPLYKRRMHQKAWKITFVGISKLVSDTLAEVYSYDRNKIETIYNGINLVGKGSEKEKTFDFFTCASLSEVKRQTLLLNSFAKVKDKTTTLKIAGDGPEKEKLISLSKELGIEDRVEFLGNVSEPAEYYKKSRVFVLTSKSEGNPLCVAEAMSAGLPVVASNVGGVPDLIENNKNGFLFDTNASPDEVAALMEKCLTLSVHEKEQIANLSTEKAKIWDIRNITKEYNELYKKVIN